MKNLHNRFTFYTRKSHATRLKSMNKILFIWWNNTYVISKGYNQINLRLSCDKIVFQSSKSSKGSECLFLFKGGWSLLIKRLSINVTLKSLLLLASMEKSSKPDEWLLNKWCSFMAELLSPFTLFPVRAETPRCSHILTLKWSFNIFSLRMTVVSVETLENWRWFK